MNHSAATIEKYAVSRRLPSVATVCTRRTPSNRPPIRSIARRDAVLRASVFNVTRSDRHVSNACVSRSSLASVLIAVRWADAAYQVLPISTTDGGFSSVGTPPVPMPGGHGAGSWNTSRSRNRVQPTRVSSDSRRTANGMARPPAACSSAASTYVRVSSGPSGTHV